MELKSTPDVYQKIGNGYAGCRLPDRRIEAQIFAALGDAKTVCNVGAGTGSYEPVDREVTAVEPSARMIQQRRNDSPVVQACAEDLPFADNTFDASMAVLTVHHWLDARKGLTEMKRVSRRQVVLTFDSDLVDTLWFVRDYIPEIAAFEKGRNIPLTDVIEALSGDLTGDAAVHVVPVPWDCTDGFQAAYWRRPEKYLDPAIRAAISTLAQLPAGIVERGLARLASDLDSGFWHDQYADLLSKTELDFGYRLVVAPASN